MSRRKLELLISFSIYILIFVVCWSIILKIDLKDKINNIKDRNDIIEIYLQ